MAQIGNYIIDKRLGQGGMGLVYKCIDAETQRPVAVKVLPQQLAADPAFLQRFKREVMMLKRLDHPNIVRIYEHGEHDGAYYYAMEYVEGVSLEAILSEKQKMSPLRAIGIIRGCAEALQHSHSVGIIHRDIKPANIMLTEGDRVKLMDFGIAKLLDATRMTATQGILGTVEYMSPEQSQGRHVDGRSDLYSLGVLLYQCLTARLPVTGSTASEVVMKLRSYQVESPGELVPELPKNLVDLVMQLLEKEPSKRVESAKALLRELDRIEKQIQAGVTGQESTTQYRRVLTTGRPASPPAWRNPWLILPAVLVVVAAVWYATSEKREPANGDEEALKSAMPAKLLLQWARKARDRNQYEKASDLCQVILKHYSNSAQAEGARRVLESIEKDVSEGVVPVEKAPGAP